MIAIVDYGMGNIRAFANVYKNLNFPYKVASLPDDLRGATRIILPGVGAFDHAMEQLHKSGMLETLEELVLRRRVPILGICIGMQILAHSSQEGNLPGLGWIDGVVKRIGVASLPPQIQLPHMGWNDINVKCSSPLLKDVQEGSRFYFLHSYYFSCRHDENIVALTEYGVQFPCVVNCGNIYGVQFHPEKSHRNGIQILNNFWDL